VKSVLLIAGWTPRYASLAELVTKLHEHQLQVVLAGMTDVEASHQGLGLDGLRSLRSVTDEYPPSFHRAIKANPFPREVWLHVQRDRWVAQHIRSAVAVVALDTPAIFSVWKLARRLPLVEARYGISSLLEVLEAQQLDRRARLVTGWDRAKLASSEVRAAAQARARRIPKQLVVAAAGPPAVKWRASQAAWQRILLSSVLSNSRRVGLAVLVISSLQHAGESAAADRLTEDVLTRLGSTRSRADLLGGLAQRSIVLGDMPRNVVEAYAAELRYADELLARGKPESATGSLLQATRLAFHRALHYDATESPLANDPVGFTAPLRRSVALSKVAARRGRRLPATPAPQDRPLRLMLATYGNTNFLGDLRQRLEAREDVELRVISTADIGQAAPLAGDPRRFLEPILAGNPKAEKLVERWVRPHLDWADVLFIDWCTAFARVLTLIDPGTTKIVLRLHSFEAFSLWPHTLDLSRIDDLIFVSEHLRDLAVAEVPALLDPGGPKVHVIPNAVNLKRFDKPKPDDARFTVGLIGYSAIAKDVLWAFEVLRRMRREDRRYRLLLVGDEPPGNQTEAARRYVAAFYRQLEELESQGAVERYGRTDDVPTALTQVGTILSSSVREGAPVGIVEGAASGAIPVVRNWPFFAHMNHGARTLFPPEWVVDTPQEAADRLLGITSDESLWRAQSRHVSAEVIAQWDLSVLAKQFDQLLLE
jgi:glycosyltransferase involved in cell wall biosynthesis